MDIYSTNNYRKIWEHFNGPIPKDEEGRSYEIHHIDGDRTNNNINNLACMPIKEHYETHYSQGDWGACLKIASKMKLDPQILSEMASLASKNRWADPDYKTKMSNFNKEMGNRPEIKLIRSENASILWKDPNFKNKQLKTRNTTEFKEKMSNIQNSEEVTIKRNMTNSLKESKDKRSKGNKLSWDNLNRKKEASDRISERNKNGELIYCKHCKVFIKGKPAMGRHLTSKKHIENMKKGA